MGIPMPEWESYDEPYKQTYPEYVKVQREKDAGAYSVKAALERSKMFENADPGWLSVIKAHYGQLHEPNMRPPRPKREWHALPRLPGSATWRRLE